MSYKTLALKITASLAFSALLALSSPAQSPTAAATGQSKSEEGFYPGWNLGVRFEGSTSGDGSVYDLGFGACYNFSRHFGVGLGVQTGRAAGA